MEDNVLPKFLLLALCTWGVSELIILADSAVGLSEFWLFEPACNFIRGLGIPLKGLLFWSVFLLFFVTDWHRYLTKKLSVIIGYTLVVAGIVICIALAIKLLFWLASCL